jgi:hypothetical protein
MAKSQSKSNAGRPGYEITPKILAQVEEYAYYGLKKYEVADALGIHVDTFIEKAKEYPEFSEAYNRGKSRGIANVAKKLMKNIDDDNVQAQTFFLKSNGWKETSVHEQHLIPHEDWIDELK